MICKCCCIILCKGPAIWGTWLLLGQGSWNGARAETVSNVQSCQSNPACQNYLKWEGHHSFPCQSMIFLLINYDNSPESPTRISHAVKILSSQCGKITSQVQSESLCLTFSKIDFFFLALNACILNYLLFGYLLSILNKHEQTCNYTW